MKFAIYYAEREFANHHSDPRLALIEAPSREEAERTSSHLAPAGVGVLAVPIRETPWRGVFFDGPQSDRNRDGDEIPSWCVYVGDEEAEPVGPVICSYTRKQAVADGLQVEVSTTASEAGITFPVFLTRSVFEQFVAIPPGVTGQDEAGRLWDIVWMLRFAIRRSRAHPRCALCPQLRHHAPAPCEAHRHLRPARHGRPTARHHHHAARRGLTPPARLRAPRDRAVLWGSDFLPTPHPPKAKPLDSSLCFESSGRTGHHCCAPECGGPAGVSGRGRGSSPALPDLVGIQSRGAVHFVRCSADCFLGGGNVGRRPALDTAMSMNLKVGRVTPCAPRAHRERC